MDILKFYDKIVNTKVVLCFIVLSKLDGVLAFWLWW